MSEESAQEQPEIVFAFAAGEEVVLPDGTHAKIVGQSLDSDGNPLYEVVYATRATLPESGIARPEQV